MANLTYFVGRDESDFEIVLQDILENGTLSPLNVSGSTLTMTFGGLQFVINGANLQATGPRTVSSGTISGFSIIDNGVAVITMTGLTLPDFADLQMMIDTAGGLHPFSEAFKQVMKPLFMDEQVTATALQDGISLFGSDFVDTLTGGPTGFNYFRAGNGVDTLTGGADIDMVEYVRDSRTVGIKANLVNQTVVDNNVGAAIVDNIVDIDWVAGTNFADEFIGNDEDNVFFGRGGADIISGGGGRDTADYADFQFGDPPSVGAHGVVINLSNAAITSSGEVGAHTVQAGRARDTLGNTDTLVSIENATGGMFADYIVGSEDGNYFEGREGNDILIGNGGDDHLVGGDGNDILSGGQGFGFYRGGEGNDTFTGANGVGEDDHDLVSYQGDDGGAGITVTFNGNESITVTDTFGDTDTGTEIEEVTGSRYADTFNGSGGDERVTGMAGADTFNLGGGQDTVDYQDEQDGGTHGVVINLSGAQITSSGEVGVHIVAAGTARDSFGDTDTLVDVEHAAGGDFADYIVGRAAGSRLNGRGGNDTVIGGAGNDDMDGEDGNDTLFGNGGDDYLGGGDGDDMLDGGAGDNFYEGRSGVDTYIGGGDFDKISFGNDGGGAGITVVFTGGGSLTVTDTFGNAETGTGIDAVKGSQNADTFTGSNERENVEGQAGNDIINLGGGRDHIEYRHDEDEIGSNQGIIANLSGAAITVDVGNGNETVQANRVRDTTGHTDTVSGVEDISGTNFRDHMVGNADDNHFEGFDGNDTLNGGLGNDSLEGGGGLDTIIGSTGTGDSEFDQASYMNEDGGTGLVVTFLANSNATVVDSYGNTESLLKIDQIKGSQYADSFTGSADGDSAAGMNGADTFNMGGGRDEVVYIIEDDADNSSMGVVINLSSAQITSNAQTGSVTVQAFRGRDTFGNTDILNDVEDVFGSVRDDYIVGDGEDNTLRGGDGSDFMFGGAGNDLLRGDDSNNSNFDGDDQLFGQAGNDSFKGSGGADLIDGGLDRDDINYNLETTFTGDSATHGVIVNMSNITLTNVTVSGIALTSVAAGKAIDARNFIDTLVSIEDVRGTGYDDILVGGAGDNLLIGNEGNDSLQGGQSGNDTLEGNDGDDTFVVFGGAGTVAGNDTFIGGNHNDTIAFVEYTAGVTITLAAAGAQAVAGGTVTLNSIESAIGGSGNDTFHGSAFNNTLSGGAGGNDTLNGNSGNDIFVAVGGADTMNGGGDLDTLTFANPAAAVSINLQLTTAQAAAGGTVTLSGIENVTGGDANDTLRGANLVNNVLNGGNGIDVLTATTGNDTLIGGGSIDAALFTEFSGGVNVNLELLTAQALGGGSSVALSGIENAVGGAGADTLRGANGINNVLSGGAGNDTLLATTGADTLNGQGDIDTASFAGFTTAVNINLGLATAQAVTGGAVTLTAIENLTGGQSHDMLRGNGAANTLSGGKGNDILNGDAGVDTARFTGNIAQYTVTKNLDGSVRVQDNTANRDGMDLVLATETLAFADGNLTVASLPTATSFSFGATQNSTAQFGSNTGWSNQDATPRMMADVNGDNLDDIVGFGNAGTFVALNAGNGTFGPLTKVLNQFGLTNGGWASNDANPRQMADVNGDGRADIVGFGNGAVLVALATGTGGFGAPLIATSQFAKNTGWTTQTSHPRQLADVNGDGRADLVGFGNGGVLVALGNANGTFGAPVSALNDFGASHSWSSNTTHPRKLADVNGDGRADIVAFGSNAVFVSLGQGNGTFAAKFTATTNFAATTGWANDNSTPRHLFDVNGDGRADIVGFGNGGVIVSLAAANGTFGAATLAKADFGLSQGWSSQNTLPRLVADVDGDGVADVIGFSATGVKVSLSQVATTSPDVAAEGAPADASRHSEDGPAALQTTSGGHSEDTPTGVAAMSSDHSGNEQGLLQADSFDFGPSDELPAPLATPGGGHSTEIPDDEAGSGSGVPDLGLQDLYRFLIDNNPASTPEWDAIRERLGLAESGELVV